jgi:hypothetical protein
MSELMDLKGLEKKAYRSIFQDGLWDLYLGGIMACLGILGIIPHMRDETWIWLIGYTVLIGTVFVLFMLGKRYITVPRLGSVKFGPKRKQRKIILTVILSLFLLFHLAVLLMTMGVIMAPGWLQSGVGDGAQPGGLDTLVPLLAGLYVAVVIVLTAYFLEFYRGFYIGLLFGLGIFIDMSFDQPVAMLVLGIVAAIPGLILLVRFIRQHPIKTEPIGHDIP